MQVPQWPPVVGVSGGRSSEVRKPARNNSEPRDLFSSIAFLPIQPSPARRAKSRSKQRGRVTGAVRQRPRHLGGQPVAERVELVPDDAVVVGVLGVGGDLARVKLFRPAGRTRSRASRPTARASSTEPAGAGGGRGSGAGTPSPRRTRRRATPRNDRSRRRQWPGQRRTALNPSVRAWASSRSRMVTAGGSRATVYDTGVHLDLEGGHVGLLRSESSTQPYFSPGIAACPFIVVSGREFLVT